MTGAHKVRENRLRRAAERQGLRLVKSRRRDPRAVGLGTYMLVGNDSDETLECKGEITYTGADSRGQKTVASQLLVTGRGTYMLVDPDTAAMVAKGLPDGYGLSLDDVERQLMRGVGFR